MPQDVAAICLGILVAVVLGQCLLFRTRILGRLVLCLLLVMGLEHSHRAPREDLEIVFHIHQVQAAVLVMVLDRHTQAQRGFSHILQVHRVHRIDLGDLLAGIGCHSSGAGVHVLPPLRPLRPLALLPFHSRPSHAYLVRLFRILLAGTLLVLYPHENLGDP